MLARISRFNGVKVLSNERNYIMSSVDNCVGSLKPNTRQRTSGIDGKPLQTNDKHSLETPKKLHISICLMLN